MTGKRASGLKPTVWILGNQLVKDHPGLKYTGRNGSEDRSLVLMIESRHLLEKHPWHPWKLTLVLSAMRHYADQLRQEGITVNYLQADTFLEGIQRHFREFQSDKLICMASTNYQGKKFQERFLPSKLDLPVEVLPNNQFLASKFNPYPGITPEKNIRQESFYRRLRRHFQILMDQDGQPLGGKWNYDAQNRQPLPAETSIPEVIGFPPDQITLDVLQEINQPPPQMNGEGFNLAVDRQGALLALEDFCSKRLENFGTYEDAMARRSRIGFHSLLSPYLNLGLLDPLEVIQAAERAYLKESAPLNSVEGFIRQVLGWREYIYWQYWRLFPDLLRDNHLNAQRDLPAFFWSGGTNMNCLALVLGRALQFGYNHHIERLMVLTNFCTLAGIQPHQVLGWFTSIYVDAYPWVMAPNLIGMGLYADGGRIGTKPYISSARYIHKMSDYCQECAYNYRQRIGPDACPFNFLYWNFLIEHQSTLKANPRMNLILGNLGRLDQQDRDQIQDQARVFLMDLAGA